LGRIAVFSTNSSPKDQLGNSTLGKCAIGDAALIESTKEIWPASKQSVLNDFGDAGWGAIGLSLMGTPKFRFDSVFILDT